jgi:RHS repeat-associated protein
MLTGSTFTWLHDDKLGRPQVATNASQTVVWKASYQPYGETLSTSGSFTQNLRFPGQYYDAESGVNHNGFRDYVPSLGRYLEADPIGIYGNTGISNGGLNPYLYVGADPMRSVDPLGLSTSFGPCGHFFHNNPKNKWIWQSCEGPMSFFELITAGCGGGGGGGPLSQCEDNIDPNIEARMELANNTIGLVSPGMAVGWKLLEGPPSPATPPPESYNYRGVSPDNPNFSDYQNGNVIPGDVNGTVTAEEHNADGSLADVQANSPYTSWTTSYDTAVQNAGPGGIVLRLPQGAPPEGATWQWEWSPDIYHENEILLRGTRSGAEVNWP